MTPEDRADYVARGLRGFIDLPVEDQKQFRRHVAEEICRAAQEAQDAALYQAIGLLRDLKTGDFDVDETLEEAVRELAARLAAPRP